VHSVVVNVNAVAQRLWVENIFKARRKTDF
jgi:hypothetical protein